MKTFNLKVGTKGTREAVKVPLQVAENSTDMIGLARGNEAVVVRCFNRGWKIENQERSGARDAFRDGADQAKIAGIVAGYDPTKVTERTRGPAKPKVVKLAKGKTKYSLEELQAALAAQGFQVEVGEPAAATA